MSWMPKDENKLLKKGFLFGLVGLIACLIPLFNSDLHFSDNEYISVFTGIGIGVQLFSLSVAVLLLRKRGVNPEVKRKAQWLTIALTVSLLFFFIV